MDWLDRINKAMDYIETHLSEEIDSSQAARLACCSTHHFQRMFSFITNVPLSEYIRRRRLTLAAFELQQGGTKVIDIAMKYGYESPEAFSRAFKKMHGVMPISARDKGIPLKAYPRISFHISIRGEVELNYKIEEKQSFEMFGVSAEITADGENPFIEIPAFWTRCIADGSLDRIRAAAQLGENGQLHGVLYNNRQGGERFSYLIGHFMPETGLQEGFETLRIPPQTYAIFSTGLYNDGESGIHQLWKRIWGEWFPTCNYDNVDGPEFEMTYDRGNGKYEMEVWIPVVKKQEA